MASFLPALQTSGSVPCLAADPGAQAYNAELRSTQEGLKIEQQFWPHTRAATSSQLALHTKPNGIHQAWVLSPSLPLSPAAIYHQHLPGGGSQGRSGKGQEACALLVLVHRPWETQGLQVLLPYKGFWKRAGRSSPWSPLPRYMPIQDFHCLAKAQISLPKHLCKCDWAADSDTPWEIQQRTELHWTVPLQAPPAWLEAKDLGVKARNRWKGTRGWVGSTWLPRVFESLPPASHDSIWKPFAIENKTNQYDVRNMLSCLGTRPSQMPAVLNELGSFMLLTFISSQSLPHTHRRGSQTHPFLIASSER